MGFYSTPIAAAFNNLTLARRKQQQVDRWSSEIASTLSKAVRQLFS
jgi:hypothetical protein